MPDQLTPDDAATFAFFVDKLKLAQHAVDSFASYLVTKYEIAPTDQLGLNGTIVRTTKADAP